PIVFICAGKEDRFSLDDALCVGMLLRALVEAPAAGERVLNDASRAALSLSRSFELNAELLRRTAAGAALVEVGLGDDLTVCAELDRHDLVPVMDDRMIRLPAAGG
ncbi:MAG: 2-phosphosulfolactate phosphatase, partial [bacterium]